MIDALIAGTLHGAPKSRTGKSGRPFVTATVRAALRDNSTVFVSVIAFEEKTVTALLALSDGDSVALAGELTPKVYTPKDGGEPRAGLDLIAHAVLTEYHVARKRKAVQDAGDGRQREPEPPPFDDELPGMTMAGR